MTSCSSSRRAAGTRVPTGLARGWWCSKTSARTRTRRWMSSASSSASAASCNAGGDNRGMPYERDVRAFDERAASYESGMLGQLHRDISGRFADLALSLGPAPRRVLDVGAGTGYLLGLLAARLPDAEELTGVDPAPAMVAVARDRAADERLRFTEGTAERLPAADGRYEL